MSAAYDATFSGAISAAGTIKAGSHGHSTRIKILPTDFIMNEDGDSGTAVVTTDGTDTIGSVNVTDADINLYASYVIPTGYKAPHYQINSNENRSIKIFECDIDDSTATLRVGDPDTSNGLEAITNVTSSDTNYLVVKWNPTATSDRLFGGFITIVEV